MSYRSISEVEKLTGVNRKVLDAWERRVRILSPRRDYSGFRKYSQRDIDIILRLKYLIYTKGYTVEKASGQVEQDIFLPKKNAELLNEIRRMRSEISDAFFDVVDLIKREKGFRL